MHKTERDREHQTEPVGKLAEERFRQQIAERIEQEGDQRKDEREEQRLLVGHTIKRDYQHAENCKGRERVADQNGPKEILLILQITVQHLSCVAASAGLLPNPQAAQSQHARFHARKYERKGQTKESGENVELLFHFTTFLGAAVGPFAVANRNRGP